jgi:hypothetical protein
MAGGMEHKQSLSNSIFVPNARQLEETWTSTTSRDDAPKHLYLVMLAAQDRDGKFWHPPCQKAATVLSEALSREKVIELAVTREEFESKGLSGGGSGGGGGGGGAMMNLRSNSHTQLEDLPQINKFVRASGGRYELEGKLVGDKVCNKDSVREFCGSGSS